MKCERKEAEGMCHVVGRAMEEGGVLYQGSGWLMHKDKG